MRILFDRIVCRLYSLPPIKDSIARVDHRMKRQEDHIANVKAKGLSHQAKPSHRSKLFGII